jgi:hypothetical protein
MTNVATTAVPVGGTEQSELVTASVDGISLGVFDTQSGGDAAAPSTQHRGGGQSGLRSYRTRPKYSEITISRVLNLAVDWELIRQLIPLAGLVMGSVTIQPLDADLNAYGTSRTATGMFLGVKNVKVDSNSDALQMFELDFSVDQWA